MRYYRRRRRTPFHWGARMNMIFRCLSIVQPFAAYERTLKAALVSLEDIASAQMTNAFAQVTHERDHGATPSCFTFQHVSA